MIQWYCDFILETKHTIYYPSDKLKSSLLYEILWKSEVIIYSEQFIKAARDVLRIRWGIPGEYETDGES